MLKAIKEGILIEGNIEKEIENLREKIDNNEFFQKGTDFLLFPENKQYYSQLKEIIEEHGHNLYLIKKQESLIENKKETLVIKKKVRSGQKVEHDGDILLLSDLAPGGCISATGNIYIIGTALGDIHAGSEGDRDAKIVANDMSVNYIRIADIIGKNPDISEERNVKPEFAFVNEDGVIELEEVSNDLLEKYEELKKESGEKKKKNLLRKLFSKS